MRGFTARTIAKVKEQNLRYLDDTCTVEKRGTGTSNYALPTPAWTTIATGVQCALTQINTRSGQTMNFGEQETIKELYMLTVEQGTDLRADYRVTIGTDIYQVVSLIRSRTNEVTEQAIVQRAASTI